MRFALLTLTLLGSAGLLAFSSPTTEPVAQPSSAAASNFIVDPVHSTVIFKVKHKEVSYFYGGFDEISGSFEYDADDASKCSLSVEIRSESVDSRNEKLDQHLRSPDFFDVKQFPVIAFRSTKVEAGGEHDYRVTGDLLLHGVTKSITIDLEKVGEASGRGGNLIGFHTKFVIDRTEFGMSYGVGGPLGSDVELTVSIEASEG
ncbi:MAG: polyisoprenoid-binding protein YceI [Planctomycetota bacterium]|jgi:polyisoprenoid-binding protein YceI